MPVSVFRAHKVSKVFRFAETLVEVFVGGGVAPEYFVLEVFLCGDEGGLGELLVVARDFNLLAVFGYFLEVVVERCEFLELLLEVVLHLAGNLVGALGDDAYGFVDVAGGFGHLHKVACGGVERSVSFLVVHIMK